MYLLIYDCTKDYADSTMYDGVSIRVFEFDDDVLVWGDEGAYYLME